MKNLILLTAFVSGFSIMGVAQTEDTKANVTLSSTTQSKMSLEKKSHDFGTI
jgi:hypothetical protein